MPNRKVEGSIQDFESNIELNSSKRKTSPNLELYETHRTFEHLEILSPTFHNTLSIENLKNKSILNGNNSQREILATKLTGEREDDSFHSPENQNWSFENQDS